MKLYRSQFRIASVWVFTLTVYGVSLLITLTILRDFINSSNAIPALVVGAVIYLLISISAAFLYEARSVALQNEGGSFTDLHQLLLAQLSKLSDLPRIS